MSQPGNRAWRGIIDLKIGSLGGEEWMRGDCDMTSLGSHRVSPHWPPPHHMPQRHTAGGSAGAVTQPPGMSPDSLCRKAAQRRLFKRKESQFIYSAPSHLPPLSFTMHRVPSPGSKSGTAPSSLDGWWGSPAQCVSDQLHPHLNLAGEAASQLRMARVPGPTGDHAVSVASRWALENLIGYVRLYCTAGAGIKIISKAQKYILLFVSFCQISLCAESQDYDPYYRSISDILRSQGRSLGVTFHVHSNPSPKTLWSTVKATQWAPKHQIQWVPFRV